MSVEMRKRVLTLKKKRNLAVEYSARWFWNSISFLGKRFSLLRSPQSIHTISTSFPLLGVYDLIRPYKFSIVSLKEVSLVIFCSIFLME